MQIWVNPELVEGEPHILCYVMLRKIYINTLIMATVAIIVQIIFKTPG